MWLKAWIGRSFALAITGVAAFAQAQPVVRSPDAVIKARFETFNHHDLDGLVALYAPDAVLTSPGFCHDRNGLAGARRAYSELLKAVPDIQDEPATVVIDQNHIAIEFTARSTRPGAAFDARLADFLTLNSEGLITRDDAYYDAHGRPCA